VGHIVVDGHLPGGDGLNVAARLSRQVNNLTYLLMMIILYFLQVVRIRIQHFRLNTDPDPIRIQGFDKQKVEKFYSWNWKEKIWDFWLKIAIYWSLGLHKGRPFFYFCGPFLTSWMRIRIPNSDPLNWLNPDLVRIRIRSTDCLTTFFLEIK
jgi:hypothetical protein